jgi:hypothetical protein
MTLQKQTTHIKHSETNIHNTIWTESLEQKKQMILTMVLIDGLTSYGTSQICNTLSGSGIGISDMAISEIRQQQTHTTIDSILVSNCESFEALSEVLKVYTAMPAWPNRTGFFC